MTTRFSFYWEIHNVRMYLVPAHAMEYSGPVNSDKNVLVLRWIGATMKKHYTAAFKAKLVVELLKAEKTLSQLAAEHQLHPNQLRQWRDLVLKQMDSLFDKKNQTADLLAAHEQPLEELYAEILPRSAERAA